MSTQAALRSTRTSPMLAMRPIDEHACFDSGVRAAVDALDQGAHDRWQQVDPVGCEWDDLLDEVSGFGPPPVGSRFEAALLALATCSDECVVWYPGDDFARIPVVHDEDEFASRITAMVSSGNIEPKLRFIRNASVPRR